MLGKPISILLVEDDDVDAEAIKRAFLRQKISNPITRATDGIEALALLRGEDGAEKLKSPYIILLDINMPRMNGIEFLEQIRNDATLQGSIIFVLTTSESNRDIDEVYAKNVAGYIFKSRAGKDFSSLVGLIDHYWRYIELPKTD